MGWSSQTGNLRLPVLLFYFGCIAWTIGYDTLYALQDIEDDALIGVKSTARLFGENTRIVVAGFYGVAWFFWLIGAVLTGAGPIYFVAGLIPAGMLGWQVYALKADEPGNPLALFKFNNLVGLALTLALLLDWPW